MTDLFHSNSIRVTGVTARAVDVRLLGAIDVTGRAYKWKPYAWRRLRLRQRTWRGALPAPALPGIYELQLRLDHGRRRLTSGRWLARLFPGGAESRHSFATPVAVIRHYVAQLPGDEVLGARRRWPLASFDHRDPRLDRLFAIAYAPRGNHHPGARLGMFLSIVREGFHGRWRLLEATVGPYD